MESILSNVQNNLLDSIIIKAKDMTIPIEYRKKYVGFGKFERFYMFWVSFSNNQLLFNSRINYVKSLDNNLVTLSLNEDNIDKIFKHIDFIYNNYVGVVESNTYIPNTKKVTTNNNKNSEFDALSDNAKRVLMKVGINTIDELLKYDLVDLIYISKCKRRTIREIIDFVRKIKEYKQIKNDNFDNDKSNNYNSLFKDFSIENSTLNLDITEEKVIEYQNIVNKIKDIIINWNFKRLDMKEIFDKYVIEGKTIQAISDEHSITKQKISTMIKRVKKSFSSFYNLNPNMKYISKSHEYIDNLLLPLDKEELYNFFYYGFLNCNSHFKRFVFERLLGEDLAKSLLNSFKNNSKLIETYKLTKEKMEVNKNRYSNLISQIKKSNNALTYTYENIKSMEDLKIYSHMIEAENSLHKLNPNLDVMLNPNIIYKQKDGNNYYPDLLVKLEDGTLVLALVVVDIFRFVLDYNKYRFKEFEEFCDKNGFASLIVSTKLFTFYDVLLKSDNVDGFNSLDKYIEENGYVAWNKIKQIRDDNSLTNYDLVAYIAKNNYHLEMKPFYISKRMN